MKKINLIPGTGSDGSDTAFCPEKMPEQNITAGMLSQAMANSLAPFASLLADGKGIAVTLKGDDASLIGITEAGYPVQCYWNGEDRENGHADPSEILSDMTDGAVVEVEHVAVIKATYEARLSPADDAEHDDDFEVCEDTREAAEAKVATELERRRSLTAEQSNYPRGPQWGKFSR